jgi:orotate phosphoribosyltransferase
MNNSISAIEPFRAQFLRFAIAEGALKFGEFRTKAGRISPYFFNSATFNSGRALDKLSSFYAQAALASGIEFDMLFGPAYKGIVLASATATALARAGRDVPYCHDRKEAKDHGEGGLLVGAPLMGRVLIVDDVISAGTSTNHSVNIIRNAGAIPVGVLIALDRQERGGDAENVCAHSATQDVQQKHGIKVSAIATLADLLAFMGDEVSNRGMHGAQSAGLSFANNDIREAIERYRKRYAAV